MQLFQITDPRDNLAKARRKELEEFAKAHGVTEIEEGMPAELMRKILRSKQLTNIAITPQPLGAPARPKGAEPIVQEAVQTADDTVEVDHLDLLAAQWKARKQEPKTKPVAEMTYWEMYHECKRRGLTVERGEKKPALEAKLNGQDAP